MADDDDKKRLYVGSLSFNTTDDGLRAHFESVGEVSDGERNNSEFLNLLIVVVIFQIESVQWRKVLDFSFSSAFVNVISAAL